MHRARYHIESIVFLELRSRGLARSAAGRRIGWSLHGEHGYDNTSLQLVNRNLSRIEDR